MNTARINTLLITKAGGNYVCSTYNFNIRNLDINFIAGIIYKNSHNKKW